MEYKASEGNAAIVLSLGDPTITFLPLLLKSVLAFVTPPPPESEHEEVCGKLCPWVAAQARLRAAPGVRGGGLCSEHGPISYFFVRCGPLVCRCTNTYEQQTVAAADHQLAHWPRLLLRCHHPIHNALHPPLQQGVTWFDANPKRWNGQHWQAEEGYASSTPPPPLLPPSKPPSSFSTYFALIYSTA